jgi:hypothetical protein
VTDLLVFCEHPQGFEPPFRALDLLRLQMGLQSKEMGRFGTAVIR